MEHQTYDDNVARLAAAHPSLFERGIPAYSDLKDGWYRLVDQMCTDIETALGPELSRRVEVRQIKEKFGALRFYACLDDDDDVHVDVISSAGVESIVSRATPSLAADAQTVDLARDRLYDLVNKACEASESTCGKCGKPGKLRGLSWVQTLCDEHFAEAVERDAREANQSGELDEPDEEEGW